MAVHDAVRTHARGGFAPVEEELAPTPLEVTGELPAWLTGTLVRVVPSLTEAGGVSPIRHWFDGLAMLNGFTIADGTVSLTTRHVDSAVRRRLRRSGRFDATGFGTDPCRRLGGRVMSLFEPTVNDNPNVNVVRLGERCLALTEAPLPVEFDEHTLETKGVVRFDDRLGGHYTTAHPHFDPATREMVNLVVHASRRHHYRVWALPEGSDTRRLIADVPVARPGYMHSFALTERFVVLAEIPLRYDLRALLLRDSSVLDTMRWDPRPGTTLLVIDRATGEVVRRATTDAFFTFHTVNAFERDGEVVLDLVAWADPTPVWALLPERLKDPEQPIPALWGTLDRFEIPLGAGPVRRRRLSESRMEFPRINYARNGRPYGFAYAVEFATAASDWFDAVVKVDVESGETLTWSDGGHPGEPVFVATPGATAEDDGVLLVVSYDPASDTSSLVVLDASDLTELGRAHAPQRLPYNFHQDYFPSRELARRAPDAT